MQSWCDVPDSVVAPWTTLNKWCGGAEPVRTSYWKSYSGNWSLDLAASCPYSIQQIVTLVPGNTYTLSFWLNRNKDDNFNDKSGFLMATGSASEIFTFAKGEENWRQVRYSFVASNASTTITIGAVQDMLGLEAMGPAIDNVSLVCEGVGESTSSASNNKKTTFSSDSLSIAIWPPAGDVTDALNNIGSTFKIRTADGKYWSSSARELGLGKTGHLFLKFNKSANLYRTHEAWSTIQDVKSKAFIRHAGYVMWDKDALPDQHLAYDFGYLLYPQPDGSFQIYNGYGGGYFVGYDQYQNRVLIVAPGDPRITNWFLEFSNGAVFT